MIYNNELRWCGVDVEKRRMIGIGGIENLEALEVLDTLEPPSQKKKKKFFTPLLPIYLQADCAFFRLLKKLNKPHKDEDGGRRVCIFALSIVAAMMWVKKLLFIIKKKCELSWLSNLLSHLNALPTAIIHYY